MQLSIQFYKHVTILQQMSQMLSLNNEFFHLLNDPLIDVSYKARIVTKKFEDGEMIFNKYQTGMNGSENLVI